MLEMEGRCVQITSNKNNDIFMDMLLGKSTLLGNSMCS